jgi:hypothetical protein
LPAALLLLLVMVMVVVAVLRAPAALLHHNQGFEAEPKQRFCICGLICGHHVRFWCCKRMLLWAITFLLPSLPIAGQQYSLCDPHQSTKLINLLLAGPPCFNILYQPVYLWAIEC